MNPRTKQRNTKHDIWNTMTENKKTPRNFGDPGDIGAYLSHCITVDSHISVSKNADPDIIFSYGSVIGSCSIWISFYPITIRGIMVNKNFLDHLSSCDTNWISKIQLLQNPAYHFQAWSLIFEFHSCYILVETQKSMDKQENHLLCCAIFWRM